MASAKTATANVGIDRNVKKRTESALSRIGLSRSVALDSFYRQIIDSCGRPFSLTIPESRLPACDEMSTGEFDRVMARGLEQAMADGSFDLDEVFGELEAGLNG